MIHSLIVGGTRGLGREVMKLFSALGHDVSVIGRNPPPDADRSYTGVKHWICDLKPNNAQLTINKIVRERGPLNYLVFCQRFRGEENNWEGEMSVSLTLTKTIVESTRGSFVPIGDKSIVMISSVCAESVGGGQGLSYHVGKAGLNQMMRYYAVELGKKGVRVNAVTPFTFLKDESRNFYSNNEPLHTLYRKITPLGRMGTAFDSAQVVAFLCNPQSAFVNGQNIYVDGGLSIVWQETLARELSAT